MTSRFVCPTCQGKLAGKLSLGDAFSAKQKPPTIEAQQPRKEWRMSARLGKTVKLKTDKTTGKTKLVRTHAYDASKARKIAKGKAKRAVPPAKAAGVKQFKHLPDLRPLPTPVSFEYDDLTGRKPKTVKATRAA